MLAKIEILNEQGLGERVYKWDMNYTQDVTKYSWERSPVEIEQRDICKIVPGNTASFFAVWDDENQPIQRARIKFDTLAPTFAYINCDVSEDTHYSALVPFEKFMAQLRADDDINTHILTKEWLDENAHTITSYSGELMGESHFTVELIYKRPIHWAPRNNQLELTEVNVNVDTLRNYYRSLCVEVASFKGQDDNTEPHPVKFWAEDNLVYHTGIEATQDITNRFTAEELRQIEATLKEKVVKLKGVTGFGRFYGTREGVNQWINETFLTLGLANENYSFVFKKRNGYWDYVINFNICYVSPDVATQISNGAYPLSLSWYRYGTWSDDTWDNSSHHFTDHIQSWTYWSNAYAFYDYHYVDELDDTDSLGPVYGRIGTNKFKKKAFTYNELAYDGLNEDYFKYLRIAGYNYSSLCPSYLYFKFDNSETKESIDGKVGAAYEEYLFEYFFWKEEPESFPTGFKNIKTQKGYDLQGNYREIPYYAEYYMPLDTTSYFKNYENVAHTYPTTATVSVNYDNSYNVFDASELSIRDYGTYLEYPCVASYLETEEVVKGIDTTRTETVTSFNPNAYPKDGSFYNGWIYTYLGSTVIGNSDSGVKASTVYSRNMNAYPRDGIQSVSGTYYHFKFVGLERSKIDTYYPNVIFDCTSRQSIGNGNSFAIGSVGGATCEFTVLKPYTEVIKYKNFDINVYYTYYQFGSRYYWDGQYRIREIEEIGPNKVRVVAYDNCYKLDCSAMPLIQQIQGTPNIKKLFYYICAYCDIPYYGNEYFLNADMPAGDLTTLDPKVTCREIIQWIAQLTATVAVCDNAGFLVLKALDKPLLSRGSYDAINKSLTVSKIPIIIPMGIKIQSATNEVLTVGELTEWENRILDWTSNELIKRQPTSTLEMRMQQVLNQFSKFEDVYSFTCDLADNRYGVVCGDSWVVEGESLGVEARRGIITDKTISMSGMTLVSSAGIDSEYAPFYTKEETTINMLINQVDAIFKNIVLDGIQLVDPLTKDVLETVTQYYDLSYENAVVDYNGTLIDISSQWRNLIVNPTEWVEVMVDGDIWKVRVYNDYLQVYNTNTLPDKFKQISSFSVKFYAYDDDEDGSRSSYFHVGSIDLTSTQLSQATELTIPYYQYKWRYKGNHQTDHIHTYDNSFTIKFPKSLGTYLYETSTKLGNMVDVYGYSFEYTGSDYEAYSKWDPLNYAFYPTGMIIIEGAYPKWLRIFTKVSGNSTTLEIRIGMWPVRYNSYPYTFASWPVSGLTEYLHMPGYKIGYDNTRNLEFQIVDFAYRDALWGSYSQGAWRPENLNYIGYTIAKNAVFCGYHETFDVTYLYDEQENYVGCLALVSRITHYDGYSAWADSEPALLSHDETSDMDMVIYNWKEEWLTNKPNFPENPVNNVTFDFGYAPVVKHIFFTGEAAWDLANDYNIETLISKLPFNPTTAKFYSTTTGEEVTIRWDLMTIGDMVSGYGTMDKSLGFVINGEAIEPEEVNWDFAGSFYNQLIYLYYAPRHEIKASIRYHNGGFIYTGETVGTFSAYYDPVSQTLVMGNVA